MIPEDVAVLQRLVAVNTNLGSAVMAMLDYQDGDGVTPPALRALADGLETAVTDLRALADAREHTIGPDGPVIELDGRDTDRGTGVAGG